jgi:hypothetical protein
MLKRFIVVGRVERRKSVFTSLYKDVELGAG